MPESNHYSEEFEDILTQMPRWAMRWGIISIFVFVMVLIGSTWFIHYPDIVITRCSLTSLNPPAKIIARSSGRIITLYVKDTSSVVAGQPVALLETTANPEKVDEIKKRLLKVQNILLTPEGASQTSFPELSSLGELQVSYSQFLLALSDYRFYSSSEFTSANVSSIEKQIEYSKTVEQKLKQQREVLKRDMELSQKKMETDKQLRTKGHISEAELSLSESQYLQKKYALDAVDANLVNNSMRVVDAQKSIQETKQQREERLHATAIRLQEAYKNIVSAIEAWEKKYILRSPITGKISFFRIWSENQIVSEGDEVFTIVPERTGIIGKVILPKYGSGKVKKGEKVIIKFDNYPYTEFGTVAGTVQSISLSSRDNVYSATIVMDKGLITSFGRMLEFRQDMEGQAEIITDDIRLMERLITPLMVQRR